MILRINAPSDWASKGWRPVIISYSTTLGVRGGQGGWWWCTGM